MVELRQDVTNIQESVDSNNHLTLSARFKVSGQDRLYEVTGKYTGSNTSTTLTYDPFIMSVYDGDRVYGVLNVEQVVIKGGGTISVDDDKVTANVWEVIK